MVFKSSVNMNQQSLEDLLAFIELRNITLAAQRRNISQPAYSRRLKALEESENTQLVDRSGRPSVPTKALTAMKYEIEIALNALQKVSKGFSSDTTFKDSINIASVHSLSSGSLPVAIQRVEKSIDQSDIRIYSANQDICFQMLMTEEVSAMVAYEKADQPLQAPFDLVEKTIITTDQLVPVCSPEFKPRLDELVKTDRSIPLISYPPDIFLGRVMYNDVITRSPYQFSQKFLAGMSSVVLNAAIVGLGVAWIPASVIRDEVKTKSLMLLNEEGFDRIDLIVSMLQLRRKKTQEMNTFWPELSNAIKDVIDSKL